MVIVDIQERGAINIFNKTGDAYVDGVGIEDANALVVIPWDDNWWFFSIGKLRVGYLKAKSAG